MLLIDIPYKLWLHSMHRHNIPALVALLVLVAAVPRVFTTIVAREETPDRHNGAATHESPTDTSARVQGTKVCIIHEHVYFIQCTLYTLYVNSISVGITNQTTSRKRPSKKGATPPPKRSKEGPFIIAISSPTKPSLPHPPRGMLY